jgi:hypothetical protein
MPEKETIEDAREGKSPSTQAGEFVREEIHRLLLTSAAGIIRQIDGATAPKKSDE